MALQPPPAPPGPLDLTPALQYLRQCLAAVRAGGEIPRRVLDRPLTDRPRARVATTAERARCWLANEADAECVFPEVDAERVDCTECAGSRLAEAGPLAELCTGIHYLAHEASRRAQELQMTRELLEKSEDLARLGQQVSTVTHELNNVICSIMGYAQLANLTGEPRDVAKLIEVALEATMRAKTVIQGLRNARRTDRKMGIQHIPDLLNLVIDHVSRDLGKSRIVIRRDFSDVPWIITDAIGLQRVFLSICSHLAGDIEDEGKIDIAIRHRGEWIEVKIAGEAARMDADAVQLAFDHFFPESERGGQVPRLLPRDTLAETQQILGELGGEFFARRTRRNRAVYTIRLPLG